MTTPSTPEPVLRVSNLRVTYAGGAQALRGVDLEVASGETVAIVGESGCGKSTLAATVLRLLPPSTVVEGAVRLAGVDVLAASEADACRFRGRLAGLVVQDPAGSFTPTLRVGGHLVEARRLHDRGTSGRGLWQWATNRLAELRIPEADRRVRHYPHQWSGGMLQRAAIAVASANHPPLLVADEPTASLDPTLAVDVMDGLREQQLRQGAAMLLITHQLGLAARVADRVAVLYAGRIVELGHPSDVLRRPRHPYTRALVAAAPRWGGGLPEPLEGELPPLAPPPDGCAFAPRCSQAEAAEAKGVHVLGTCTHGSPPELVDGVACPVVRAWR